MDEWKETLEQENNLEAIPHKEKMLSSDAAPSKKKEKLFGAIFSFQLILCLIITICMLLFRTFAPQKSREIDRVLKEELARPWSVEQEVAAIRNQIEQFREKELSSTEQDVTSDDDLLLP